MLYHYNNLTRQLFDLMIVHEEKQLFATRALNLQALLEEPLKTVASLDSSSWPRA